MKKLIFITIFLLIGVLSHAQILKFESEAVSYRTFDVQNNKFDEWKEWEPTRVLIVVNLDEETVDIWSKYEQHYKLGDLINTVIDEDRKSYLFDSVDEDFKSCIVELAKTPSTGVTSIYIRWSNLQIVYQMNRIP